LKDGAALGSATFKAYCDQVTDGGGWMLTYAYSFDPLTDVGRPPVVSDTPPLDPDSSFRQADLGAMTGYRFSDLAEASVPRVVLGALHRQAPVVLDGPFPPVLDTGSDARLRGTIREKCFPPQSAD